MKEKTYLGDWLYNAGIVGFLRINQDFFYVKENNLISKDENLIKFGENFIEIDRKIFENFSQRFFDYSFQTYIKFYGHLNRLKSIKNNHLKQLEKAFKQNEEKSVSDLWKSILKIINQIDVKKKYGFSKAIPKALKNIEDAKKIIDEIIEYIANLPPEVKNKKAVDWFRANKFFQKNWLNSVSINTFKTKYEVPLIKNNLKNQTAGKGKDKIDLPCIVCYPHRSAKKDKKFSTSISNFAGLNADLINFIYMPQDRKVPNKIELPLCDICEIVYFLPVSLYSDTRIAIIRTL
ncbi:type I-B CRISPR-associated protein Cas8b1/Cst1 [Deferribacter autotrophicus]|uniref:Type I-B CRISPR-associated protein Cas8b1/Cst1 n=1 Tax=Deferribacter autotrophicus TaxID=500465 RepID=A0A5A8F4G5_9BACT|nr:type I-B CRISPR-associated protein Cas8b1/Cst1 [Deferribacter autotrophicus]KAA0257450.1 type I-B CRISPR-associated protein Cas8b1/Cst1 [Deferribacter autotrophicus]